MTVCSASSLDHDAQPPFTTRKFLEGWSLRSVVGLCVRVPNNFSIYISVLLLVSSLSTACNNEVAGSVVSGTRQHNQSNKY